MMVIDERENVREIFDDLNPRIRTKEFRCYECKEWVNEEDTVWVNPQTGEATTGEDGKPFHVECAPEQEGD